MENTSNNTHIERVLLAFASIFLLIDAVALTLAPAARLRTWQVDYRWWHWVGVLVWLGVFWAARHRLHHRLPERDPFLLPLAALLTGWGLLTIYRLTPGFGIRQTAWLAISGLVFIAGLSLPGELSILRRYKYVWLTSGLLLTAATLFLGTNPMGIGPRLWLGCCGFYFQPSEPLKLLLVVYLAAYLADRRYVHTLAHSATPAFQREGVLTFLAPTLVMTGLALLLLVFQRDLGTASIFLFLYAAVVYTTTGDRRILFYGGMALILAGIAGYTLFDVVRLRVDAWLNPWADPSGGSYQIIQSLLAVANGGLFGRGPGLGNPGLVPVPQSDFIFAAIAEEFGLVGSLGLLALVALLLERGLRAALLAADPYRRALAAGLTAHLAAQSLLIIGGNLRLLPLTGVTLPFVSYGGSSLLVSFIELLCLVLISASPGSRPMQATAIAPYRRLAGGLLLGFLSAALVAGWWGFWRGPDLLTRTDNPRRAITDRFVRRGSILDWHDQPLAASQGSPGDMMRVYTEPGLGAIVGYTHPVYGQSGLEASLDTYLRGLEGYPSLTLWWEHLLYGQPPPGLDVRLSLDLEMQLIANNLFTDPDRPSILSGAVVLLNAQSGEILVMLSSPSFDANRLEETWENIVQDAQAPLFDRAALGLYSPGASLGAMLWGSIIQVGRHQQPPATLSFTSNEVQLTCACSPAADTWGTQVGCGCPAAVAALGDDLGTQSLLELFDSLGFYTTPQIRLPALSQSRPGGFEHAGRAALGLADPSSGEVLQVSPLQMALAAAALSNGGLRPAPRLVMALNAPQTGWATFPPLSDSVPVFTATAASAVTEALADHELPIWQSVALAPGTAQTYFTWYIGGTLPSWPGAPMSIAVFLEREDPALAVEIGRSLLTNAMLP